MGTETPQVLHEKFRTIDCPTVFLKIDTDGDKTRRAGSPFQYFRTRTEKAPLLRQRRLGLWSNLYLCARSPARGGWRKKSDGLRSTSPLKILKARMRSARRCLRSCEKRLSSQSLYSYGMWRRPITNLSKLKQMELWFLKSLNQGTMLYVQTFNLLGRLCNSCNYHILKFKWELLYKSYV